MSQLKYLLTNESITFKGVKLRRIRAVKDIRSDFDELIQSGCLGGWIESEENLSHAGLCWVHADAKVYGKAQVLGDAGMPRSPASQKSTASKSRSRVAPGWGTTLRCVAAPA